MLYNICYSWFLLSQGNQWTKYLVHPKIRRSKPCLLMFGSLVTLDNFHLLLAIQLTAILTLEWNAGSMFYPLSHIYAKTPFCCIETAANNCQYIAVFDWLWENTAPTLSTSFSLRNVQAKWWIHCLLISSTPLLSYATSIYDQPKGVWSFLFSRTTDKFRQPERSASFVSILLCLKSAYHLLTIVSDETESE